SRRSNLIFDSHQIGAHVVDAVACGGFSLLDLSELADHFLVLALALLPCPLGARVGVLFHPRPRLLGGGGGLPLRRGQLLWREPGGLHPGPDRTRRGSRHSGGLPRPRRFSALWRRKSNEILSPSGARQDRECEGRSILGCGRAVSELPDV